MEQVSPVAAERPLALRQDLTLQLKMSHVAVFPSAACVQATDEARGLGVFMFQRLVCPMLTEQGVSGALRVQDVTQPRLFATHDVSGKLSHACWPQKPRVFRVSVFKSDTQSQTQHATQR